MIILILNWRSIKDKLAGGAELATFEYAKNWAMQKSAKVIWVSPVYKKGLKKEVIDGIEFNYLGIPLKRDSVIQMMFSVPLFYFLVLHRYLTHYRKFVDVIIDQPHGIPYLTPLYSNKKIVVYIHEVAGDIWDKMYKFPVNKIGKTVEKLTFLPYKMRKIKFVTVSNSTKNDLVKLGIHKNAIEIVYNGVSLKPIQEKDVIKNKNLTVIYLNRIVKMKGIERAIDVFAKVVKIDNNAFFHIVGYGDDEYIKYLKDKISKLKIEKNVKFWGFVDEKTKVRLLRESHVLINTSYKEGWGLVNIEANTQGTPAVSFDVSGNRESIKNGINGYVVRTEDDMVRKILEIYKTNSLIKESIEYSKQFDWKKQSNKFYDILNE